MTYQAARSLGDVWALQQIWGQLGLSQLGRLFKQVRYRVDVEALVRVMVFHRLCHPGSKLGVLRWLQGVAFPALTMGPVEHLHCLCEWRMSAGFSAGSPTFIEWTAQFFLASDPSCCRQWRCRYPPTGIHGRSLA